jgi:hypothetical protein
VLCCSVLDSLRCRSVMVEWKERLDGRQSSEAREQTSGGTREAEIMIDVMRICRLSLCA